MKVKILVSCILAILIHAAYGQGDRKDDNNAVTFEELYDEPYLVNKLFIGFQPLYGEVFATNVNAGFGIEASYYHKNKMDFKAHFRKTYSSGFYDFTRDLASRNNAPGITTKPEVFNYYEFGGTYHIKDFESTGKTKMVLYKRSYKGNMWAARVPLQAVVPCKVRKIYGARLGAVIWNSTTDLSRAMTEQGLTNLDITTSEGVALPVNYIDANGQTRDFNVYGNIYSTGLYVGGSISWIRNIAVSFDKYEEGIDDGMLTLFFDIQYAPAVNLDPIIYQNEEYSTKVLKTRSLGFRAGIDGKFNRQLGWAYGGEFGYRPSLEGRSFFAMLKISFPIFGTNLNYKVETFAK